MIGRKKFISHYNKDIQTLITKLRYKNAAIHVNGSASNPSLKYFGDIDLFSKITGEKAAKPIYDEISDILFKIRHHRNYYFMELKIQLTDDSKVRVFPGEKLKLSDIQDSLNKLDFIKLDLVLFVDYRFIEVSSIYQFGNSIKNFQESLKEDIKKYLSENNYFKILKRYFSLYLLKQTHPQKLEKLVEFFNSKVGYLYSIFSNLDCISELLQEYTDAHTKERIKMNLASLHLTLNSFETAKQELYEEINSEAKKVYSSIII